MKTHNSFKANAASQALQLAAGYGLNLLVTPLIVAKLGVTAFGIWSLTGAISQYGALFDFGITRSVTRYVALHHARGDEGAERRVRAFSVALLLVLFVILTIVFYFLVPILGGAIPVGSENDLRVLMFSAVVILMTGLLARAFASMSYGRGKMVAANIALAANNMLTVGVGALSLIVSADLIRFAMYSALGSLLGLLVVIATVLNTERELWMAIPRYNESKEMLIFGLKGQAVSVSDLLVIQSSKIVLGFVAGPATVGVYEIGSRLAQGARALGVVLTMAATPVVSAKFATGGLSVVKTDYPRTTFTCTSMALFAPALVGSMSPLLIVLWLGASSHDVLLVVIGLCFAFVVNLCTGAQTIVANAVGLPGAVARAALISACLNAIVIYPMTSKFGIIGALSAVILSTSVGAVFETLFVHRAIDFSVKVALQSLLGPLIAATTASAAVSIFSFNMPVDSRLEALALTIIATSMFTMIYLSIVAIFRFLPPLISYRVSALARYAQTSTDLNSHSGLQSQTMQSNSNEAGY